ncbi:MAG: cytochrome c [Planctomycetes bacterium]|nr:cytochrome c [Planctomycetota bacterium]
MRFTTTALVLAGVVLGACSKAAPSAGPVDGAALFREQNCVQCHGPDGSGSNLAPTLHGKQGLWTRETLAEYIANSPAYAAHDERLKEQATHYSLPMTSYPGLSLEQRLALADLVLGMK